MQSFIDLRNKFHGNREDVGNYIQSKIGAILNEIPSHFGCIRWVAELGDKKVTLDLYITGEIVFNLQTKLSITEQTSLDTSRDFLEPDMEPSPCNYFNLRNAGQLEKLVKKIKEHFSAVPA